METLTAGDFLRPELTSLNRLPMRAPLALFADGDAARAGTRPRRRLSLDGAWQFQLCDSPAEIPGWWPKWAGRANSWGQVDVPGCWTMDSSVDDWPHYTNIIMPWPGLDAPATPERNPVGLYRRTFDLPKSWMTDDVVLHLGGFESVAAVWCNGAFVGMSKDSRLAAEFSLAPHAVAGENQLCVMVIRYSDATWIEDQDHWWHGGLHRSVFIEARPSNRIDDVAIVADFDPTTGQGHLRVDARVQGDGRATLVRVSLLDGDESRDMLVVGEAEAVVPRAPDGEPLEQLVTSYEYRGPLATVAIEAGPVRPWTAETPDRYLVIAELVDRRGKPLMALRQMVGFRRVEVRDRRFLVNGAPVVFHGVNRHDHHPDTGKVVSIADLRADLETMRTHNINAIRCAHYPNDPALLDLCDELGFWVIDEANVESHSRLRSVSDDPRYLGAIVDRVSRMVIRDRNHPSVVAWSLGNESGHGAAHDAAAGWVRAADPSRPVHYEGAIQRRFRVEGTDHGQALQAPSPRERAVTDLVCPMYTHVDIVEAWARWAEDTGLDDRPMVLCEYSHAMGNSNGGFVRYAEAFHAHPALAGGFIWDWKDQGLRRFDAAGIEYWAYGGDYGDEPNDANFCINGLVGPDGLPHPGLAEVAWGYQPVRVRGDGGSRLRVENRRSFTDLSDLRAAWFLVVDGETIDAGSLGARTGDVAALAPGESLVIDLPTAATAISGTGADVVLRVEFHDDQRLVAFDEIELVRPDAVDLGVLEADGLQAVELVSSAGLVRVGETSVRADADGIRELVVAGQPVSRGSLDLALWRAPIDNDGVAQGWMSEIAGQRPRWLELGLDRLETTVVGHNVLRSGDLALVIVDRRLQGATAAANATTRLLLTPSAIVVDEQIIVPDDWADLPRLGSRFEVDASLDHVRWYGLGPHETYGDRRNSGRTDTWASTVHDQYHPFVVPQEHGAHHDTRWFELRSGRTDNEGQGLRFSATNPLSFSARFHHDADLTAATTLAELALRDTIEVHVDAAQRGLGTGACGPDTDPEYRIGPGEHRWRFTITTTSDHDR